MNKLDFYELRRSIGYKIPLPIRNAWDNIRFWLNPRQKWLFKKIPNHWIDKDALWEICIFEGIKHHVECDDGLRGWKQAQNDSDYPSWQKKRDREMKEYYDMVTKDLPQLEKKLEKACKKHPEVNWKNLNEPVKPSYEEVYGESDRLEKEIEALKTKIMVWAVKNRGYIWT